MAVEIPVNLLDVITADIGPGRRSGRSSFWSCPFHGDHTPSLTIMPDGRRWKCFGCGRYGDAIDWVKERRGVLFREAVGFLNGRITDAPFPSVSARASHKPPRENPKSPTADWSRRASLIIRDCELNLGGGAGETVRPWLYDRGLRDETLAQWKVGCNPEDQFLHGLFGRAGITIPWLEEDRVISVKIRRLSGDDKYASLGGSRPSGVFLHQDIRPAIPTLMVEGEFDALLAWQEVRDLVNVGTLGSASKPPDQRALIQLLASPLIFLCYDNDRPGEDGVRRWQEVTERIRVTRLPHGKDLTEFFLEGGDIRSWISTELRCHTHSLTRHPTVDQNAA